MALHYRQAPELGALCGATLGAAVQRSAGLILMEGKMIVEVKAAGVSKGTAIRDFLAEAPFIGCRPLFAGDDTTDEAGFDHVLGNSVGIGEAATVPTSAAVANAIHNAIGVRLTEIPIRPDRIVAALKGRDAA